MGGFLILYLAYYFGVRGSIWILFHLPEILDALIALVQFIVLRAIPRTYRSFVSLIRLFLRALNAVYDALRWVARLFAAIAAGRPLLMPELRADRGADPEFEAMKRAADQAWAAEREATFNALRSAARRILGLAIGASEEQVRQAHRAAMDRARRYACADDERAVNAARDVLLDAGGL